MVVIKEQHLSNTKNLTDHHSMAFWILTILLAVPLGEMREVQVQMDMISRHVSVPQSKVWFKYPRMFLASKLGQTTVYKTTPLLSSNYFWLTRYFQKLVLKGNAVQKKPTKRDFLDARPLGSVNYHGFHKEFEKYSHYSYSWFSLYTYQGMEQETCCPDYKWTFQTDKYLRLNMTFLTVYFSSLGANACLFGSLFVTMLKTSFQQKLKWDRCCSEKQFDIRFQPEIQPYTLCGIHSKISVFPPHSTTSVLAFSEMFVLHFAEVLFSVTSENVARTARHLLKQTSEPQPETVMLGREAAALQIFHISVSKLKNVIVSVMNEAESVMNLFDGPGTSSAKLKPATRTDSDLVVYKTSAFVCLIHHIHFHKISTQHIYFTSGFCHCHNHTGVNVTQNNSTIDFKTYSLKIVSFSTEEDSFVKISNISINFDRNNTASCIYGGLAAYRQGKEIANLCAKYFVFPFEQERDEYISPNIYSIDNSLELVLFTFQSHLQIIVSLSAGYTKCTPLMPHLCKTKLGNIAVSECNIHNEINFLLSRGHCVILQYLEHTHEEEPRRITKQLKSQHLVDLQFTLPITMEYFNTSLMLSLNGFLRGKFVLSTSLSAAEHKSLLSVLQHHSLQVYIAEIQFKEANTR